MFTSKKVNFLNKEQTSVIEVDVYYEDYYIKKGFKKISNKFQKIIFLKFLRFPKLVLKIFKISTFCFKNPDKKDYIIYDDTLSQYLEIILKDKSFFILSTRIERMKKFYFSKEILIYIFKNFFKRSLKQNYLAAVINQISPKIVVTHIDNSNDFSITTKIFKNSKIKFIAIQNSGREGDRFDKFYFDKFFVFGKHYKDFYINKNVTVNKFHLVGSLKASLIKEILEKRNKEINKIKYDICLISEPQRTLSEDFSHIEDYAHFKGKIAKYTVDLCKKNNLRLVISGKFPLESDYFDFEKFFYKRYLNNENISISQGYKKDFNSYFNIMQSNLIIGANSTMLQESILFKKKILSCAFINHPDFDLSFPEECVLKDDNYSSFEKKVLSILSINQGEYLSKLSSKFDYIMKTDFNFREQLENYEK